MRKILALSSSRVGGGGYLEEAAKVINDFLGTQKTTIAFIPFASVDRDYEAYGAMVQQAIAHLPYELKIVKGSFSKTVIEKADVIMVGGGNTFKLLHDLYQLELLSAIQHKVNGGSPYIGWSAGANITGLGIGTTNDMPIIQPPSFSAFGFLPFQINPHYLNENKEGFHGETRDQRLGEFIKMNKGIPVFALPEGTALRLRGEQLQYVGNQPGYLFSSKEEGVLVRKEINPGEDVSFLM